MRVPEITRRDFARLGAGAAIAAASEARALVQLPGQIIFVARSGMTPRRALQQAISQIDSKKLQGLVLNNAYAKTHNYYYGYSNPADRGAGKDEG